MFKSLQRENMLRQNHRRVKQSPLHNSLMSRQTKDRRLAVKRKVNNKVRKRALCLHQSKYNRKKLLRKRQKVIKMQKWVMFSRKRPRSRSSYLMSQKFNISSSTRRSSDLIQTTSGSALNTKAWHFTLAMRPTKSLFSSEANQSKYLLKLKKYAISGSK